MPAPVYLDHNATTPIHPEVLERMRPYLEEHFGNPGSAHPYGWAALEAVQDARREVAGLLGCDPDEVIFTSSGTESNNLALRGAVAAGEQEGGVVTSAVEHPAIVAPCARLAANGVPVRVAGVSPDGRVRMDELERLVDSSTALVSVMLANNETGTLQPLAEISRLARDAGALAHTDAAQAVGKIPCRVDELGVDLLSVAGHKLYAPKGVGALYVREGTPLAPVLDGAGHERQLRPGTENVAGIVGLGAACALTSRTLEEERRRVGELRDELWRLLVEAEPRAVLHGHERERLPNTLNLRFPGVRGGRVLAGAHEVAASTGSACHEGGVEEPSPVLVAMGLEAEDALGAIRLTLGRSTTREQVRRAAAALIRSLAAVP